jgi:hypothetical protein
MAITINNEETPGPRSVEAYRGEQDGGVTEAVREPLDRVRNKRGHGHGERILEIGRD